jgi:hypothetical protein
MNNLSPLEVIFFAALEKASPQERVAYLDDACADQRSQDTDLFSNAHKTQTFSRPPAHPTHNTKTPKTPTRHRPFSEKPGDLGSKNIIDP